MKYARREFNNAGGKGGKGFPPEICDALPLSVALMPRLLCP